MRIPNLTIIMRDDWIEITCCDVYSGVVLEFKFYPDGRVVRRCIDADCDPEKGPIDVYAALSWIADTTAGNLKELSND